MRDRTRTLVAAIGVPVLLAITAYLVYSLPIEQVLGSRVKLPIFHGASTWVSLITFTWMGVFALIYMFSQNRHVFAWESGLRWVSMGLWVMNTVLGLVAALNTWDFTGSKDSPLKMVMVDPRLRAQFWLLIATGVLLIAVLLLEKRFYTSIADFSFTVLMWGLLGPVLLDPNKQALHPDNPVLNSGWEIKGPFFAIVACILAAAILLAWVIAGRVAAQPVEA